MNVESVEEVLSDVSQKRKMEIERKRAHHFLKGPIPLVWFEIAADIGGKATAVVIAIWFESGLMKSKTIVIRSATLDRLKINRKAMYRILEKLEDRGLIQVIRNAGRKLRVEIKEFPQEAK